MKKIIFLIIRILGTILSFFNFLMFLAMRPCWSGISGTIGYKGGDNVMLYYLPVIICALFLVILICDLILKPLLKKNWLNIVFLGVGAAFFVVILVIIKLGAIDYLRFIWPNFFLSLAIVAPGVLLYFLIFIYPQTPLKDNKIFKNSILGLAGVSIVLVLLNFSVNYITQKPVVYAVEDKYQIVFSTNSEATGWVEVGGKNYYDVYAGSTKKYSKIHKIEVPMTSLDNSKKYTIHTQQSIYCGPFGGFLGRDITETINFQPVNIDDGIQYLSFSDIHMNIWQAAKTASYVKNYDFLVLAGDLISDVETFDDANFNNKIAYEITKGEKPVVYARGNHDVKGVYGEQLHKFVGAKGENFYYNFYFKNIYGLVLDIGEDHDDDWWEYYGTSHYDDYREEQIQFVTNELEKRDFDNYDYHLVVSHIPIPFVNYRHNHEYVKNELTRLLNEFDVDMYLCGHQHDIMIFEPGLIEPNTKLTYNTQYKKGTYNGYLTDFNFPSFMLSKPGFTFDDDPGLAFTKSQIGFFVDVDLVHLKETCYYLNSRGEKVDVMNMFAEKHYGTQIEIDLITKKFKGNDE